MKFEKFTPLNAGDILTINSVYIDQKGRTFPCPIWNVPVSENSPYQFGIIEEIEEYQCLWDYDDEEEYTSNNLFIYVQNPDADAENKVLIETRLPIHFVKYVISLHNEKLKMNREAKKLYGQIYTVPLKEKS